MKGLFDSLKKLHDILHPNILFFFLRLFSVLKQKFNGTIVIIFSKSERIRIIIYLGQRRVARRNYQGVFLFHSLLIKKLIQ